MDNRPRRRSRIIGVALMACGLFPRALPAAIERLASSSYVAHHVERGAVVIDGSGAVKLRITFASPGVARVQVAPDGAFAANPSPAVDGPMPVAADTRVVESPDALLILNGGLTLRVDKKHLRVDAYDGANARPISLESPTDGTAWDAQTGGIRQSRVLQEGERIYGLGQDNANRGTLDRRGTSREMWTGQQIRSGNVTASYPVPFFLATGVGGAGYGCFVDNAWHMQFDLGRAHHDLLTWTAPGGPIDYYLFAGPTFKQIIDDYTKLTGRPSMLPLWAFGFWQSRCFFGDFPDIQRSAGRIQAAGLPIDVVVVDSIWSQFEMNFKWTDKFLAGRSAKEWMTYFHDRGIKVIVSTKGPMIRPDADIYPEAKALGVFATDGKGNPVTAGYYSGHLLDVTSPSFAPWLKAQLRPLTEQGTDGWWLDLNEPEGEPPQTVYHGGTSADTHNRFSFLNNKAYFDYCRDVAPDSRPVILGRAGTAGIQRLSGILWTGDINSDWPTFRAHVPELQNSGLSGLPYWTNDSGGFISGFLNNDRYGAHAALYERWFEFTCFAPIARAHKAGPSEPYEFGPVVEATAKKYLQLRYRLMPYLYGVAREATVSGMPICRPLVLAYQDDAGSATAKTEFLFGPDLLVAPVIWANATSRDVYFPPGEWISFDEGFQVSGGRSIGVAAPHDRIPLFVRAGTILPMAPEMTSTGQKPWDPITLEIWPHGGTSAAESTGSLYQDDGATLGYARGERTTTQFRCVETPGKSVALCIEPSNDKFGPSRWVAVFHLTSTPTAVSVDGVALPKSDAGDGWSYDAATNRLTATFAGKRATRSVMVTLDGSSHLRPAAPKVEVAKQDEESSSNGVKQTAQFLPAPKLPIRIEAANFDKGGEGLAFHVIAPYWTDLYRTEGVPIASSTDVGGGYVVPGLKQGEWLAYTVDAGVGGWFDVDARVSGAAGGQLALLRGRTTPLTSVVIPAAADKSWSNVPGASPFYVPAGEQIVTFSVAKPGIDLGNFTFKKVEELGISVEAESGELAGAGGIGADHPGYAGTGFVAGLRDPKSSITLRLRSAGEGTYRMAIRYANGEEAAEVSVAANDGAASRVTLPSLGNWADYGEVAFPVTLKAGENVIRVGGTGHGVTNVDQLRLLSGPNK